MIGIRKFLERLSQYCFNNHFSPDIGTPSNNIPPLDEVDDGDTFSTFRALHFPSCISASVAARTIPDLTEYSASSVYIESHHISKREEVRDGGRYNSITIFYCSGRLPLVFQGL